MNNLTQDKCYKHSLNEIVLPLFVTDALFLTFTITHTFLLSEAHVSLTL